MTKDSPVGSEIDPPRGFRKDVRLLVVDDHRDQFDQIEEFAEMYNPLYRVECKLATSEEQARTLISSWRPSVLLIDVHLPNSIGLALIKNVADQGTPVVATSQARVPELADTVKDYGAVGYMPKTENPDDVEALLEYIASVSGSIDISH